MRIGIGEDTHRLVADRALVLGGVDIKFELGLLGHSDADVLTHAIMDALLGAAALGDIGKHFPDNNEIYRGISSLTLLARTAELLKDAGYRVGNIDSVIIAQKPKLAPYIPAMRENIAGVLGVETDLISVKATTPEGLGPEGLLEGITVRAVALIEKI